MQEAQGWFFQDPEKMRQARDMEMTSCRRLQKLGAPMVNAGTY
jgi:DnaJ family protein B protein 12